MKAAAQALEKAMVVQVAPVRAPALGWALVLALASGVAPVKGPARVPAPRPE